MNTQESIQTYLGLSRHVLEAYISDLDDDALFVRPVSGMNHIAWQLGHLISSENKIMNEIKGGISPDLPDGFTECYTKETCSSDDRGKFHSKQEYLDLMKAQRAASLQILETLSDEELDKPAPEDIKGIAPTIGAAFALMGAHDLMHAGQFVAVRRQLDKPVLI